MLVRHQSLAPNFALPPLKSFLLWSATLACCSLAFSVPLGLLFFAIAAFCAVILHVGLLLSQTAILAGSFVGLNLIAIVIGAAIASQKNLYPRQIKVLNWLRPQLPSACPLTCELAPRNKA